MGLVLGSIALFALAIAFVYMRNKHHKKWLEHHKKMASTNTDGEGGIELTQEGAEDNEKNKGERRYSNSGMREQLREAKQKTMALEDAEFKDSGEGEGKGVDSADPADTHIIEHASSGITADVDLDFDGLDNVGATDGGITGMELVMPDSDEEEVML